MGIEVFNRYEKKYIITDEVYRKLLPVLEDYMEVDSHSRNGQFYNICNIYYDTPDHSIIRKSIEKPVYKEKLRLRSYGVVGPKDKVYLEIKKKYEGAVNKRRTKLTLEEAYHYINTKEKPKISPYINEQVLNEIDYFIHRYELVPSLYLSYDRNAFFGKDNKNFRVTFDTNIRSRRIDIGLEKGNHGEQLLTEHMWVMEVKMDKAAPLWFSELLSEYKLYSLPFSKYGTEFEKNILKKS